jgi:hypothetical protein
LYRCTKLSESQKKITTPSTDKGIYVFTLLSKVTAWSFIRNSQDFLSAEHKMAVEALEAKRNSPDLLVIR